VQKNIKTKGFSVAYVCHRKTVHFYSACKDTKNWETQWPQIWSERSWCLCENIRRKMAAF